MKPKNTVYFRPYHNGPEQIIDVSNMEEENIMAMLWQLRSNNDCGCCFPYVKGDFEMAFSEDGEVLLKS